MPSEIDRPQQHKTPRMPSENPLPLGSQNPYNMNEPNINKKKITQGEIRGGAIKQLHAKCPYVLG
jgi:hypothetical protein